MSRPPVICLVVAAGRGVRAGGGLPKQYRRLAGEPVLARTLRALLDVPAIDHVLVIIHPDDRALHDEVVASLGPHAQRRLLPPAHGGATRARSVQHGLAALGRQPQDTVVLIHDAARPFIGGGLVERAIAAAQTHGAAVPTLAVTDTIKQVDLAGLVVGTPDRSGLRTIQTPQAFRLALISAAHEAAAEAGRADFTDDGAVAEWAGLAVHTFAGEPANIKLTTEEDFAMAEARLAAPPTLLTRVATGYDVHAFGPGDHIWLCGVKVPHDHGVLAHSDGDVALHAACDAIFGLIGDGDIGVHFPPSDPRWRGAASSQFLTFACGRMAGRGGVIDHIDISVVCERPKIGPHREAMRTRIAEIAGLRLDQVGLKATTSERMGFTGRAEGLAALATVTARLPAGGRDHG